MRVFGVLFLLGGCSSDDDTDADEGPYGDVVEWRCFEGPDDCWCAGLGPGEEADSSNPRVDACSHANCYTYEYYGWKCECHPEAFEPESDWENPKAVPACPPE